MQTGVLAVPCFGIVQARASARSLVIQEGTEHNTWGLSYDRSLAAAVSSRPSVPTQRSTTKGSARAKYVSPAAATPAPMTPGLPLAVNK